MHNKLYEKTKKLGNSFKTFVKQNYKILTIEIIVLSLFLIPTGTEIYSPGSLLNLEERIEIEDAYEKDGTINATYVTSRNGTVAFYLLAKIIPSWDIEDKSEVTLEGEEYDDAIKRQKISLESANENAIMLAYKKSNKKIDITDSKVYVLAKTEDSKTNLKVGDEIIKIDNQKIEKLTDIENIIKEKNVNEKIKIKVIRDEKEITVTGKLIETKNKPTIGVYLQELHEYKTEPKIKIETEKSESGASAGLMTSLQIYNLLNPTDITKGLTISGTGTIDSEGNVGSIDGVKYKLAGAVKKHADVFISPEDNYKEAQQEKEKHNYKIKILKVSTFDEALEKLNEL